jgi:hypothetical protein
MITAIASAENLMDCNGILRDLCSQHRRKSLSSPDFIRSFTKLAERAVELDLHYFGSYDTYAPKNTSSDILDRMHSASADLTERRELQEVADLLRNGTHRLPDYQWQLTWHFLLQRGVELGIYWNSETKRFK